MPTKAAGALLLPPHRPNRNGERVAMMLARVIGNVVSTVKDPGLEGRKLLLIQPLTRDGRPKGRPVVGIDSVGAGFGETVYWCRGREASLAFTGEVPSDCSIVGIVDTITPRPDHSEGAPLNSVKRANSRRRK